MDENQNTPKTDGLSDILSGVMSNPELMEKISGIMGNISSKEDGAPTETKPPVSGISDVLANPDLMSKLPEIISVLRPMLSEGTTQSPPKKSDKDNAAGRRLALLFALKPYLSPRRCEAIDYIARMSKMGDLMKNIKF